jgi:hypothetical protein
MVTIGHVPCKIYIEWQCKVTCYIYSRANALNLGCVCVCRAKLYRFNSVVQAYLSEGETVGHWTRDAEVRQKYHYSLGFYHCGSAVQSSGKGYVIPVIYVLVLSQKVRLQRSVTAYLG